MMPKEAIAKWIGDNQANIDSGYLTELPGLGAEMIIGALTAAGYRIEQIPCGAERFQNAVRQTQR